VRLDDDIPDRALLVVDGSKRLACIAVMQSDLADQQARERRGHVLSVRHRVDLVVVLEVVRQRELARILEDQEVVVADLDGSALAAPLRGSEKIVEIGAVPGETSAPSEVLRSELDVRTLVARHVPRWRVRQRHAEIQELDRIGDVDVVAEADRILVALQYRVSVVETEVLRREVRTLPDNLLL